MMCGGGDWGGVAVDRGGASVGTGKQSGIVCSRSGRSEGLPMTEVVAGAGWRGDGVEVGLIVEVEVEVELW